MTVTSFGFFLFLLIGGCVYYIVPRKIQWIILLVMSVIFYLSAATPYTIVYLILSTLIAYVSTNLMRHKRLTDSHKKIIAAVTFLAIFLNIFIWFVLKGSSFWVLGSEAIHYVIPAFPILPHWQYAAAIGMGYYTAQVIGYILDCYWENSEPQKNPLKLFLFVCFFPQLTVGPISRYSQLQVLYEKHEFSYQNLCFGCQRILWGVFKKLVISDRVGIITNAIWADTNTYTGFWPWIAVFLYPLQMYTDFSGCVDIILGAAEIFDIKLLENFKNPFFSRTCQEFWQRWHITLGAWAKDYVYYPMLKSAPIIKVGKWAKRHFGKRTAKLIPWAMGMGVLWFVMGFWHGSVQHIFGVSLWFWTILVVGEIFSPQIKKCVEVLHINAVSFSWHLFQSIRTYLLFALGVVFFSAPGMGAAVSRYQVLWTGLKNLNPWIFFDNSVLNLGVTQADINLIIFGVICLLFVANLREKYGYARVWMQKQILAFRWFIWIAVFFIDLVCGLYGLGFDASQFIYQGF